MWCVVQQARLMAASSLLHALLLLLTPTLLRASCRAAGQRQWWLNPPHSHEEFNTGHGGSPLQCPSLQRVDSKQPDIASPSRPTALPQSRLGESQSAEATTRGESSARASALGRSFATGGLGGSAWKHRRASPALQRCLSRLGDSSFGGLQIVAKFGVGLGTRQRALVNGRHE